MSRSIHPNLTADQRAERRARRRPRPTARRTGTKAGLLRAESRASGTTLDDLGLTYPTWQGVRP